MASKERELLRRAKNNLAKLCSVNSMSSRGEMLRLIDEAIKGIDEFLASEPESYKPVAWIRKNGLRFNADIEPDGEEETPLYLRPPAPERKPMTVEEIRKLGESFRNNRNPEKFIDFARAIEKHHGIGGEE